MEDIYENQYTQESCQMRVRVGTASQEKKGKVTLCFPTETDKLQHEHAYLGYACLTHRSKNRPSDPIWREAKYSNTSPE